MFRPRRHFQQNVGGVTICHVTCIMALARSLDRLCWSAGAAAFLKEGKQKWTSTGNGAGVIKRLSFLLTATSSQGIVSHPKGGQSWRRDDCCCYSTRQHEKSRDLYAVMGVTPHATQQQIKEAYYKLSMEHHPSPHYPNYRPPPHPPYSSRPPQYAYR